MAAAAILLVSFPAAAEPQALREERLHFASALSFGACARDGTGIAGVGPCVELPTIGLLFPFRVDGWGMQVLWELGASFAPIGEAAYPGIGVRVATGGFGALARFMVGGDLGAHAFARLGAQLRATVPLSEVRMGGDGVLEVGFRPQPTWEIGLRGTFGATGVTTVDQTGSTATHVFAHGSLFFVRVVFR